MSLDLGKISASMTADDRQFQVALNRVITSFNKLEEANARVNGEIVSEAVKAAHQLEAAHARTIASVHRKTAVEEAAAARIAAAQKAAIKQAWAVSDRQTRADAAMANSQKTVSANVAAAAATLRNGAAAADRFAEAYNKLAVEANKAGSAVKNVSPKTGPTGTGPRTPFGDPTKLAAQYFLFTRALRAVGDGFKAVYDAAREGAANVAAAGFFKRAGKDIEEYRKATMGMISDAQLMKKANLADSMGINETAFKQLAQVAKAASLKTGQSYDHMFESIMLGTARSSRLLLDNLGIIVSVEKANENYARAVKAGSIATMSAAEKEQARTMTIAQITGALSDSAKKQAFVDEVLRQSAGTVEEFAAAGDNAATKFAQLDASVQNFADAIKEKLIPSMIEAISGGANLVDELTKLVHGGDWVALGKSVGYMMLGGLLMALGEADLGDTPIGQSLGLTGPSTVYARGEGYMNMGRELPGRVLQEKQTAAHTKANEVAKKIATSLETFGVAAAGSSNKMHDVVSAYFAGELQQIAGYRPVIGELVEEFVQLMSDAGKPFKRPAKQVATGPVFGPADEKRGGRGSGTKYVAPAKESMTLDEAVRLYARLSAATPDAAMAKFAAIFDAKLGAGGMGGREFMEKVSDDLANRRTFLNAGDDREGAQRMAEALKLLQAHFKSLDKAAQAQVEADRAAHKARLKAEQDFRDLQIKIIEGWASNTQNMIANTFFSALQGRSVGRTIDRGLGDSIGKSIGMALEPTMAPLGALAQAGAGLAGGVIGGIVSVVLQLVDSLEPLMALVDDIVLGAEQLVRLALTPLLDALRPLGPALFFLLAAVGQALFAVINPILPLIEHTAANLAMFISAIAAIVIVAAPFLEMLSALVTQFGLITMFFEALRWWVPMFERLAFVAQAFNDALIEGVVNINNAIVQFMRDLGWRNFGRFLTEDMFKRAAEDKDALNENSDAIRDSTAVTRDLIRELRNLPTGYRVDSATYRATTPLVNTSPMIGVQMDAASPFLRWRI